MQIKLNDLYLYPLNAEEFSLWINDLPQLEKNLNSTYCAEKVDGILKDVILSQLILGLSDSPNNWNWYTCWFLIRKSDKKIIGILSFKGIPNSNGEVNIGYALAEEFRHKGYMTQAVLAICKWAKQHKEVKSIIAETKTDNYSSQKLLKRCGFEQYESCSASLKFRQK